MGYAFPDAVRGLYLLLDGQVFAGSAVTTYRRLTVDFADALPAILVYRVGGSEAGVLREDRIGVDVYAVGTLADDVANAIRVRLAGRSHPTPEGLLDTVSVSTLPHEVPYPHDAIRLNSAVYLVPSRPVT